MSQQRIHWLRLLAESVAIIASILGALAVDATWEYRQDRRAEQDILRGLERELASNIELLDSQVERIMMGHNAITRVLAAAPAERATLEPTLIDRAFDWTSVGPSFNPADDYLVSTRTTGGLSLIQSDEIRLGLARFTRLLEDAQSQYTGIRSNRDQLFEYLGNSTDYMSRLLDEARRGIDLSRDPHGLDFFLDALADQQVVESLSARILFEMGYLSNLARVKSEAEEVSNSIRAQLES